MIGQCKTCRRHKVEISQPDRYPGGTSEDVVHRRRLVRNKQNELMGICADCETEIPSTKAELREALNYVTRYCVHMFSVLQEIIEILPDEGSFNLDDIHDLVKSERRRIMEQKNYWVDAEAYKNLRYNLGRIVIASARMKQETVPLERKHAARSVSARGDIMLMTMYGGPVNWEKMEREYGRWAYEV